MVDGCVNNLKESEVSSAAHRGQAEKKPKKRTLVIKKLHEKQVAIAMRTEKPVPKYLKNRESRKECGNYLCFVIVILYKKSGYDPQII